MSEHGRNEVNQLFAAKKERIWILTEVIGNCLCPCVGHQPEARRWSRQAASHCVSNSHWNCPCSSQLIFVTYGRGVNICLANIKHAKGCWNPCVSPPSSHLLSLIDIEPLFSFYFCFVICCFSCGDQTLVKPCPWSECKLGKLVILVVYLLVVIYKK